MSKSKSILSLLVLILMSLSVTACNTVEGAGRDLEEAGEEVQEAAADASD
jgi:predicted small secreted protein